MSPRLISDLRATPNQLTLLRLIFIPFIVMAIVDESYRVAFGLLILAGLSDALDGWLARVLHQRTRLGEYLDPIADKLLLSTLFLVLSVEHRISWRFTVLVFSRDVSILIIAALLYATTNLRDFRPSIFGKANTLAQILSVLAVVLAEFWPVPLVSFVKKWGLWSVALFTILSAMHYLLLTSRRLRELPPG